MKIVDRVTFLTLPEETVFARYEPCIFGELSIKLETCGRDFVVQGLVDPWFEGDNSSEDWINTLDRIARGEPSPPLDFDFAGRDGAFKDDQLYAVWEAADLDALIDRLIQARDARRAQPAADVDADPPPAPRMGHLSWGISTPDQAQRRAQVDLKVREVSALIERQRSAWLIEAQRAGKNLAVGEFRSEGDRLIADHVLLDPEESPPLGQRWTVYRTSEPMAPPDQTGDWLPMFKGMNGSPVGWVNSRTGEEREAP